MISQQQICDIVTVTRHTNGEYELKFHQNFEGKITEGATEDVINWDNTVHKLPTNLPVIINCPYPQQRRIFGIANADKNKIAYVSEKHIPMQGTPNFRDLGGIVNKQGRQLRWGAIFRSGRLTELTNIDLEYFKTLNIKTVIDFRTHEEIERHPDLYPSNMQVNAIHAMIGNPADMSRELRNRNVSEITPQQADSYMLDVYSHFTDSLSDFQPIFDTMLTSGRKAPFLFHCTAGKDRTGIAAALLLSALNVDREIIFNDYMMSNPCNAPFYEENLKKTIPYGFTKEVVHVLSHVKRHYLEALFCNIEQQYGSTETMLEKVFGLTPQKQQALLDEYTI